MGSKEKKADGNTNVDFDFNGSIIFESGSTYINSLVVNGDAEFAPLVLAGEEVEFEEMDEWDDDDYDYDDDEDEDDIPDIADRKEFDEFISRRKAKDNAEQDRD